LLPSLPPASCRKGVAGTEERYNAAMCSKQRTRQEFHWPIRVYYEDTDAGGVVYYANYLRFCERARTEWLRALGFDQRKLLETESLAFVVTRVEADYRRSAELDDELDVITSIAKMGAATLTFNQTVMRGEMKLFVGVITIACVDMVRRRAVRIPDPLLSLLESNE
jgi:acyl-CoA thioester hydrolase